MISVILCTQGCMLKHSLGAFSSGKMTLGPNERDTSSITYCGRSLAIVLPRDCVVSHAIEKRHLKKAVIKDVKIPHTQGYVACNTHRSGYLKPTQPSRLGLPLALWFVRIQARCHLCSHNSTWKSFRVAAASGHLTGTAYGQAVKP